MLFLGGVITDQAEADEDTSLKERVAIAVGKLFDTIVYYSASYIIIIKFCRSDPLCVLILIIICHVGSTAAGVQDLDSMKYNSDGKAICSAVESMAEKAQEEMGKDKESKEE